MNTHKAEAETTVLFTNLVNLVIGKMRLECSTEQELGC